MSEIRYCSHLKTSKWLEIKSEIGYKHCLHTAYFLTRPLPKVELRHLSFSVYMSASTWESKQSFLTKEIQSTQRESQDSCKAMKDSHWLPPGSSEGPMRCPKFPQTSAWGRPVSEGPGCILQCPEHDAGAGLGAPWHPNDMRCLYLGIWIPGRCPNELFLRRSLASTNQK